jgi:hypothetical protein
MSARQRIGKLRSSQAMNPLYETGMNRTRSRASSHGTKRDVGVNSGRRAGRR